MAQKMITGYTPPEDMGHISADDDAQMHRGKFTESGILEADNRLDCTIVDDNTVRLESGMYSNQGFLVCVPSGQTETFTLVSGTQGAFRKDLIVADFTRGGGEVSDTHVFRVVTGTEAASLAAAADPALVQDDLPMQGARRQEALYRVIFSGVQVIQIDRLANIIAANGQIPYVSLVATSGQIALSTNTIYKMTVAGATQFVFPAPTSGVQDQIMVYAAVIGSGAISWPSGTRFVLGATPLFRAGRYYRIIAEYDPNAGAWCVGAIES